MLLPAQLLALCLITAEPLSSPPPPPAAWPPATQSALGAQRARLLEEIADVERLRPSGLLLIPAFVTAGAGALSVIASGIINVHIDVCYDYFHRNPRCGTGPYPTANATWPMFGGGIAAIVVGASTAIVIALIRHHYGPRLDELNAALELLDSEVGPR